MADGWDETQQDIGGEMLQGEEEGGQEEFGQEEEEEHEGGEQEEQEQEVEDEGDILDMGDDLNDQSPDVLLMRFCPNDAAMLYPREDKRLKRLMYGCRLCRYVEDASNQPLVYRNEKKKEVGNILHTVPSAVSDDPTLARSYNEDCSNCHHNVAVFFQSDIAQADSLALIFVCCNCDHKWVK